MPIHGCEGIAARSFPGKVGTGPSMPASDCTSVRLNGIMSLFRKDVRDACAAVIKNNLNVAVGCSKRRFDHDDLGQPKHN